MSQEHSGISLLDHASRLLATASTLDDLKSVRDVAESARTYAKAARLGLELQNRAAEVKLRAERKVGAFLSDLQLRGGDRRSKKHRVTLKLDDLEITKHQSRRWQLLATLPENEFAEYIHLQNAHHRELTARGVMRLAIQRRNQSLGKCIDAAKRSVDSGRVFQLNSVLTDDTQIVSLIAELSNHLTTLESILQPLFGGEAKEVGTAERRLAARIIREMRCWISEVNSQRAVLT